MKHMERDVEDLTEEGLKENMPNMIMIDLYVRHYFRGEVVKTLVDSGIKVACYGAGWETLKCQHPENIINGKLQNSLVCLKEISRAKISLNVMPWFKEGGHDRVFNSMLNGAVCITDWSKYLEDELQEGKDVLFYELDELQRVPERVSNLLNNREKWEYMQREAYRTAKRSHTWEQRVRFIHKEILCKIP